MKRAERMDESTLQRLEFDAIRERLAAQACSPAAVQLLNRVQPWNDPETITRHFDAVMEILALLETGGDVALGPFDDCETILELLDSVGGMLDASQWLTLLRFQQTAKSVRGRLHSHRNQMPNCWDCAQSLEPLSELTREIRRVFDDDGLVRNNASTELRHCRDRIRRLEKNIDRILDRLMARLRDAEVLQDSYWTERGGRRVLPIRAGSKGKLQGIVHDTSGSGETLFVEPFETIEPTNQLAQERKAEQEEIVRILRALADTARLHLDTLQSNRQALIQIDLWNARAKLAYRHHLQRPALQPGGTLRLVRAHHPLLYFTDPESSVPIDLSLEEQNKALIITGPNTGGKTTALKTVALLSLMAQCAIPIPAAVDSSLPVFAQVLAEVGDDQSVRAGLSTFSAHIRQISAILDQCESGALVLLDELGKATDPLQAGALGRAIVEALIERGALILVSTHLGTLKDWAHEHPAGRNASFGLDPDSHRPLFKIRLDTPGISEAFTIARAEGLPGPIVDAALLHLPDEERDMTQLLERLHAREAQLEDEQRQAREATEQTNLLRKQLEQQRREATLEKLEHDKSWESEYKRNLDTARREIEARIAQLPSREDMSQAREDLIQQQRQSDARRNELEQEKQRLTETNKTRNLPSDYIPKIGDWVTLGGAVAGRQTGCILKINEKRKRAKLRVGSLEIETRLSDLLPGEAPEAESTSYAGPRYTAGGTSATAVSPQLDIVGQRVDAGMSNLDKYLDRAMLGHLDQLRIVHGHGTGALRAATHDLLRSHPLVESFRLADPRDGGQAVTLVRLKS